MQYIKNIEENIVFASTRKLLGLGRVFDRKLVELQEGVVEKYDVLDLFQAKSQLQVDAFSFILAMGVFAAGVFLMFLEVTDDSPLRSFQFPSTCLAMKEDLPDQCVQYAPDVNSDVEYRIDLPTLFAYFGAVQARATPRLASRRTSCVARLSLYLTTSHRIS